MDPILTVDFDLVTHSMWTHKTIPTVVSSKLGEGVGVELKEEGLLPSVGWVKWLPRAGHVVPGPRPCDGANRNTCVCECHRSTQAGFTKDLRGW